MSTTDYLTGLAFSLPTLAAALGAAWLVLDKRCGYLSGLSRALGFCVLATAAMVFSYVVPAALGVLARGTALAMSLALLGTAWRLEHGQRRFVRDPTIRPPPSGPGSVAIAVIAVTAVAVYELTRLRALHATAITNIDMLGFHLPGVARWIQTGSVWQIDQFLPGFETAQYPNNGDFLILSTVLPWHDLAFARLPAVLFLPLTGIGVYALSLELGARKAAATTFAAVVLAVPPLSADAIDGLPDDITLAMLALGLVFLVRHARSHRAGELALGGLALGVALGTKWFGFTACVVVVVVWVVMRLIGRDRRAQIASDGGLLLGTIALGGGFWLVRNLVESGNPLYPKAISVFGLRLFAGSHGDVVDRTGYTIADYLGKPSILRKYIYPAFETQLGLAGVVLLAGLGISVVWSLRAARSGRRDGRVASVLAVALVPLGAGAVYLITPGSAYGPKDFPVQAFVNVRWLMPAVVIAAAVCASAARALGRWEVVLELAGLAAVVDGLELSPGVVSGTLAKIALGLAVVLIGATIGSRWIARRRPRRSRPRAIVLSAVTLAVLVVVARVDQRGFDKQSYAPYDPVFAWIDTHAPSGHRIGYTGGTGGTPGLAPALPAFGPRLGNSVTYVGDVVVHSARVPTRETAFQAELRRGRYDLLMIGLPYAGQTDKWARALGFPLLARSNRVALYSVAPGARG